MAYTNVITDSIRAPGDFLGDYAIVSCVAAGLFGALYRARDGRTGQTHLVQVLPETLAKHPGPAESLKVNVAALKDLRIPSLLSPDLVEEAGQTVVVRYPDFAGTTLARYMEDPSHWRGLPEAEAELILGEIGKAFAAAAAVDVRHLALAPDQVLIDDEGCVKVFGFGVFSAIHRRRWELFVSTAINPLAGEADMRLLTALDVISPEVRNNETGDERSDLYGFGVLIYWLLCGEKPGRELVPALPQRLGLGEGWGILVDRCVETRPADRYPHFAAMLGDLRRVASLTSASLGEPAPSAGPIGRKVDRLPLPASFERRFSRRNQRLVRLGIIGAMGIASVGMGALLLNVILRDGPHPGPPDLRAPSRDVANVILSVQPARARIDVPTVPAAAPVFVSDGEAWLRLPSGSHEIRLEAPGFRREILAVDAGRQVWEQAILLREAFGRLRVDGPPGGLLYALSARPGEASVYVASIPESGSLSLDDRLLATVHNLEVRFPGHAPHRFEGVRLSTAEWTLLEARPEPLPGRLVVLATESGLPVRVNGRPVGETPLEIEGFPAGQPVKVEVGGGARRLFAREIVLDPGGRTVLDVGELEVLEGELSLEIRAAGIDPRRFLDDLVVRLGGELLEPATRIHQSLQVGLHTLEIEHPDFFPMVEEVTILHEVTANRRIDLQGRPARLRIDVADATYRLFIDGVAAEAAEHTLMLPPGRDSTVVLAVPDFMAVQRVFRPGPNEAIEWTPEMRPIPGPGEGREWALPNHGVAFSWIPPGSFTMGSPRAEPDRLPNEEPLTLMRFTRGFWMAQHETTQAFYRAVAGDNPSRFIGADHPVDSVTRAEAIRFAERLTELERRAGRLPDGFVYRLPTEAEWEYAARAGTATPFPWGATADESHGNFVGRFPREFRGGLAEISQREEVGTVAVGRYAANPWGLFDLFGNVREWTLDAFHDRLPGREQSAFVRREGGRGVVVRGGSWQDPAHRSRVAARERANPDLRHEGTGFRLVLAPELP